MKKILTIVLFLFVFIKPIHILAADKSYEIDRLIINAQITEKGDVEVKESITYAFHGSFNGIYRNLSNNGASANYNTGSSSGSDNSFEI